MTKTPECTKCSKSMKWLQLFSSADWYCPCDDAETKAVTSKEHNIFTDWFSVTGDWSRRHIQLRMKAPIPKAPGLRVYNGVFSIDDDTV